MPLGLEPLGTEPAGGSSASTSIQDFTSFFVRGLQASVVSQGGFVHGFIFPLPSFGLNSFISGIESAQNNFGPTWAVTPDGETTFNSYRNQNLYTNGFVNSLTKLVRGFIVNGSLLINMPTEDGNTDPATNQVFDYGPFGIHGILINNPTWVEGPYAE